MRLIPVVDLKDGVVVQAVSGQRQNYRPVQSSLCASATFTDVAKVLLQKFRPGTIYIADLDAIEGNGNNYDLIAEFHDAHRDTCLWLDHGIRTLTPDQTMRADDEFHVVVGSETFQDVARLADLPKAMRDRFILSLDFKHDTLLGEAAQDLMSNPDLWPQRVIVMTLDQVGTRQGPDLARLSGIVARAGQRREVFAAGGMRSVSDLRAAASVGAAGALVATSLHDEKIKPGDLDEIAGL